MKYRALEEIAGRIPGGKTGAQKAIQWARSAPGVTTALVGMKSLEHVRENLALAASPRMTPEQLSALVTRRN